MDCECVARDEIAEKYACGQLDSALQDEFEVHLLECRRCLELLEAHQTLHSELSARASDIRLRAPRRHARFPLAWLPVAAVLILGAGLALVVVSRTGKYAGSRGQQAATDAQQTATTSTSASPAPAPAAENAPGPEQKARRKDTNIAFPKPPQDEEKRSAVNSGSAQPGAPVVSARDISQPTIHGQPVAAESIAEAGQQKLTPPATDTSAEIAAELFRLGVVDPEPYTFPRSGGTPDAAPAIEGYAGTAASPRARAAFREGMLAYVERRYDGATELLENALGQEPDAVDVNFYLGMCQLLRGRPGEATQRLTVAARKASPLLQAAHFYLGKAYIQSGNLAQAEAELQAAIAVPGRLSGEAKSLLSRLIAVRSRMQAGPKSSKPEVPEPH